MPSLIHASLIAVLAAEPAAAEVFAFDAFLGRRQIGTVTWETTAARGGTVAHLRSDMDNTPLGVGDGTFDAVSEPARMSDGTPVTRYVARTDERVITVTSDRGTVVETRVSPESEATTLSEPALVPQGVLDLAAGFGRFVQTSGCPAPFGMYDGRRVISVGPTASVQTGGLLTCRLAYTVVAGPGHLSPFRFRSIRLELFYRVDPKATLLEQMDVHAGIFAMQLVRHEPR